MNHDIVGAALQIVGDYHQGVAGYAQLRWAQEDHGLTDRQNAIITDHLASVMAREAVTNGWNIEEIHLMAIPPQEILACARLLDPSGMLLKIVTVAYALSTFRGKMNMYTRLEEMITDELEYLA